MSRPTSTAPAGALAALVVALVAGIFGMHALTLHGSPPAQSYDAAAGVEVAAMSHGGTGRADGASDPATDHGSGEHSGHLLMLCAAMLGGAAIALLGLLVGPGHPLRRLRTLMPAAVLPAPVVRVRATGPPPAWQFSVIRC
jgi:hypothetical protein